MTAKEYLNQVRNLDARINRQMEEKEDLRQMMYSIGSSSLDEKVQTTKKADASFTRTIEKITVLEERITAEIIRLTNLKIEALTAIAQLENANERAVLKYRYFENRPWLEIGQLLHISERTARRIHGSALKKFSVPNEN